jgi:sugar phosphate permease
MKILTRKEPAVTHSSSPSAPGGPIGVVGTQRWSRLLPIVFITYSLAYLDRSNFSVGVAGGMKEDLAISSGIAALIGAAFFLGYFLFQIPGAVYAERRSVKNLIFWSLILWGALAAVQGVLHSSALLIAVRFLIGVVEAAVLPAMVIFLSHWFTKAERGRANTYLILGNPVTVLWLTAVSGYLIEATSWRGMFIIEGLPAIAWAFVFRKLVQDRPEDATWLGETEKRTLLHALDHEQRGFEKKSGSYLQALRSRNVVLLSVQYFLWSLGIYGFVFWLPSIVKDATGQGIGATGLIAAIPYVFAVAAMIINGRISDKTGMRSRCVWPWLLVGGLAFYGSYAMGGNFWAAFALLVVAGACMYAPYGPYFAHIPELLPRDQAAPSIALVNSLGAVGGFAGSYLIGWLNGTTGSTDASFLLMAACLIAAAGLMFLGKAPALQVDGAPLATADASKSVA